MKKTIIKVYRWVIISITLQVLVLISIDNFYLNNNKEISTTPYDNLGGLFFDKNKIKIPENALNIKVSFDKSYVVYFNDGKLVITDIKTKKDIKTIFESAKEISYYRWMSDRNTIVYATKEDVGGSTEVEIITLDIDNEQERKLPKITRLPKTSQINAIELSHLTNVIYAKVLTPTFERIYSFDIMSQMGYITQTSLGTIIKEANYQNILFFDEQNNKISIWNGSRRSITTLNEKSKCTLLGVTVNDEVMIGIIENDNMISTIKKGKFESGNVTEWDSTVLEKPIELDRLICLENGKVYIDDIKKSTIFEVGGSLNKQYDGKLIQLSEDSFITLEDNKIKINKLK